MLVSVCLGSVEPSAYYSTLLTLVRGYVDGNVETTTYEEQLREMYGIHAYVGFTLDKLLHNIVRQVLLAVSVCISMTVCGLRGEMRP